MAIKVVNRSNPAGTLIDLDDPTKAQVLNATLLIELDDGTTAAVGTIRQIIENAVNDRVIRALQNLTRDLRYNATETWATAGDNAGLHATGSTFGNTELQAVTDWAANYDIPSAITENTGSVVIRIPEDANPHDYRILLEDGSYVNFDDSEVIGFGTLSGFQVYLLVISFRGEYAVGNTLVLQHHGVDAHTDFYGGVPEIETAITDINSALSGKREIPPVEMDIDNHFYVRGNVRPVSYALELKNVVSALLPSVNNIHVVIKGSPVHSVSFDTSISDQVISVELSGTELQNTNRNIRSDENFIVFEVQLREDSTIVHSEHIPIAVVDAPPVSPSREILSWNLARATTDTATLPTNYAQWQFCKVLVAQGDNIDTVLVQTSDLARGNLTDFGRGNNKFSWNSSTRVFTPTQGRNPARFVTIALI